MLTSRPRPSRWLTVYAADLVRTGDGQWKVLRDLTDAPSGAGYALLNRTVLSRLFPGEHRELGVLRLTDFFVALRAALPCRGSQDSAGPTHRRAQLRDRAPQLLRLQLSWPSSWAILWPRAATSRCGTGVVLAAIARRAGAGRCARGRVEGAVADPLELGDGDSGGVPGLLHACREGGVGLANAVGSGAAGELALHPVLPARCPNGSSAVRSASRCSDTLWCGDDEQRTEVLAELAPLVVHESAWVSGGGRCSPISSPTH